MALEYDTMCGHCYTAWDLVYHRVRSVTSIGQWLSYCRRGGCDPDIWDFVNEEGGLTDEVPPFDPTMFHRRNHMDPYGWKSSRQERRVRYTPSELAEQELEKKMAQKAAADEIEWDDDSTEEEEIEWE